MGYRNLEHSQIIIFKTLENSVRFKRLYPTSIVKTWPKLPRKSEFYSKTMESHSLHLTQICRLINTRKLLTSKYFTFKHGYTVNFACYLNSPHLRFVCVWCTGLDMKKAHSSDSCSVLSLWMISLAFFMAFLNLLVYHKRYFNNQHGSFFFFI